MLQNTLSVPGNHEPQCALRRLATCACEPGAGRRRHKTASAFPEQQRPTISARKVPNTLLRPQLTARGLPRSVLPKAPTARPGTQSWVLQVRQVRTHSCDPSQATSEAEAGRVCTAKWRLPREVRYRPWCDVAWSRRWRRERLDLSCTCARPGRPLAGRPATGLSKETQLSSSTHGSLRSS